MDDSLSTYFVWLTDLVGNSDNHKECRDFLYTLFQNDFIWIMRRDENRAEDGLDLRRKYFSKNIPFEKPCSILEMLIGLSYRMDYVLYDSYLGPQIEKWFWLLINNLNLHAFADDDIFKDKRQKQNLKILERFVERRYSFSGKGGLFPLNNPLSDQREVEIWYQMHDFIQENYD